METLVALVVLSISITLVLQLFSGGMNAKARAEDYTRAVFHAAEIMELTLVSPAILDEPQGGEFDDGYAWTVELAEEVDESDGLEEGAIVLTGPRLYRVTVEVSWQRGESTRRYRLTTLTLIDTRETGP